MLVQLHLVAATGPVGTVMLDELYSLGARPPGVRLNPAQGALGAARRGDYGNDQFTCEMSGRPPPWGQAKPRPGGARSGAKGGLLPRPAHLRFCGARSQ